MKPKIISIECAVPLDAYTQEEIFAALGYNHHFWPIFRDAGILHRHFWVPPAIIRRLTWQEQQDIYQKAAIELSLQAINKCLNGFDIKDIRCLTFSSCTGFAPGPTVAHHLGRELGLRDDVYYLNISSMGCEGGFPGLKRAHDFVITDNQPVLVVACELAECSFFPENGLDKENDYELLRGNAIFADAAAAALIWYDGQPRHPQIADTEVYTDTGYIDHLGYVWRDGRLRVRLSREVPRLAADLVEKSIARLLDRNRLLIGDIKHWIVHAAGNQVLDNIRDTLGIPEQNMTLSRKALYENGNCSSATIGIIGKMLMDDTDIADGDLGIVVSIGPGMTAGSTLLWWR